jgi:hypothetical protein
MAYLLSILLHCPLCKYGLDEIQARAMNYSIYFLLALLYTMAGIFAFKVHRMMAREELALKEQESAPRAQARPVAATSAK